MTSIWKFIRTVCIILRTVCIILHVSVYIFTRYSDYTVCKIIRTVCIFLHTVCKIIRTVCILFYAPCVKKYAQLERQIRAPGQCVKIHRV